MQCFAAFRISPRDSIGEEGKEKGKGKQEKRKAKFKFIQIESWKRWEGKGREGKGRGTQERLEQMIRVKKHTLFGVVDWRSKKRQTATKSTLSNQPKFNSIQSTTIPINAKGGMEYERREEKRREGKRREREIGKEESRGSNSRAKHLSGSREERMGVKGIGRVNPFHLIHAPTLTLFTFSY